MHTGVLSFDVSHTHTHTRTIALSRWALRHTTPHVSKPMGVWVGALVMSFACAFSWFPRRSVVFVRAVLSPLLAHKQLAAGSVHRPTGTRTLKHVFEFEGSVGVGGQHSTVQYS